MKPVVLNNIVKTYNEGKVKAVNDVSFEVKEGELFGLIGPDGAGKTTIFRILTTLLMPDEGSAFVNGLDCASRPKDIRRIVGYMPGKFSLYQDLSVEENLNFFASVFNTSVKQNYDLIKDIYFQLEPFKTRRAGQLSGGMKQKLALCCALIHRPEVLFLDEPTTGVDAVSRKEFWEMLKRLKSQGITIVVSTPYMDEAVLCERIALLQNGRTMTIDTPENVISSFPVPLFSVSADDMAGLLLNIRSLPYIGDCNTFGREHHVSFRQSSTDAGLDWQPVIRQFERDLTLMGSKNVVINRTVPTIEDCFIRFMGQDGLKRVVNH
jgi:ABC-type multidrug transport system ATPase subunit